MSDKISEDLDAVFIKATSNDADAYSFSSEFVARLISRVNCAESALAEQTLVHARERDKLLAELAEAQHEREIAADILCGDGDTFTCGCGVRHARSETMNKCVYCMIAKADATIKQRNWTLITPANLPKAGDEVLHYGPKRRSRKDSQPLRLEMVSYDWSVEHMNTSFEEYRRPIAPPAAAQAPIPNSEQKVRI